MARSVTVIPAVFNPITRMPNDAVIKRRVAGYARVSTDSEEQLTSYEAQVQYYTDYITQRGDWTFVKVYTDEGISGLNTRHRDGFTEMIDDALSGKIDLIITKSVSRFARNTVDSLSTIRRLKEKGVEVYFEKENIWTFDGKGELLLTIMASLAQEESRSISENVTWGQRRRFEQGKVNLPYKQFLGYERGESKDDPPVVNPEQAVLVRRIYTLFMHGKTCNGIAKILTAEGIPTPAGKEKWRSTTIESILTNEKYKGSARLQKKYTVDFLTKKMKVNEGEIEQYYIEESHEPIIPPVEWEAVQDEMRRRKSIGRSYSGASVLNAKLICGDCGEWYGRKTWHSTDKYKTAIWQCNNKYGKDKLPCRTPHVTEEEVKARFLKVYNGILSNRAAVMTVLSAAKDRYTDTASTDSEMASLINELEVIAGLTQKCVSENASAVQNQEEYARRYNELAERYGAAKTRYDELSEKKSDMASRARRIEGFLQDIADRNVLLTEFDECLWLTVVDSVVVHNNSKLTFRFTDGMEIEG